MAWEWELRDTCQTSVRYAALGDSMLSWSAAEGAPTGAADLGDGVGEFWALTDGSLGARERKLRSIISAAATQRSSVFWSGQQNQELLIRSDGLLLLLRGLVLHVSRDLLPEKTKN